MNKSNGLNQFRDRGSQIIWVYGSIAHNTCMRPSAYSQSVAAKMYIHLIYIYIKAFAQTDTMEQSSLKSVLMFYG